MSSWGYALDAGHLAHYGTGSFTSTVGTGTTRRLSSNASRTAVVGEFDRITVEMPTAMDMTQIHHRTAGNANLLHPTFGVAIVTDGMLTAGSSFPLQRPSFPGSPQHVRSIHFWPASDHTVELEFGALAFYEHHHCYVTKPPLRSPGAARCSLTWSRAMRVGPIWGWCAMQLTPHRGRRSTRWTPQMSSSTFKLLCLG